MPFSQNIELIKIPILSLAYSLLNCVLLSRDGEGPFENALAMFKKKKLCLHENRPLILYMSQLV